MRGNRSFQQFDHLSHNLQPIVFIDHYKINWHRHKDCKDFHNSYNKELVFDKVVKSPWRLPMNKRSNYSALAALLILSFTMFSLPFLPSILIPNLPGKAQASNGNGNSNNSDHTSVIVTTYDNSTKG